MTDFNTDALGSNYDHYNMYFPCINPNCKSHGSPHPNCRCYTGGEDWQKPAADEPIFPAGVSPKPQEASAPEAPTTGFGHVTKFFSKMFRSFMAEGGEVKRPHFCNSDMHHNKDCEYYTETRHHADPSLSVSSFLGHHGLHGILGMDSNKPDQIQRYNQAVKRGHKRFDAKVNHLFGGGSVEDRDYTKEHERIENWLEKGGITQEVQNEIHAHHAPQNLAKGGDVKPSEGLLHDNHVAIVYPEQNMMLQAAKGRVSSYLNGLKPQKNQPKLAFDDEPDTRKQEKSYKRALKTAANPLRILDKIKKGTIEPEHVEHLKNLYPELSQVLQKKVTEQITKAQLKGEKPNYKIRQGLSLLLGTPLSGEMSPQNMMAAQATFQKNKQAQQAQNQPQKKLSAIGKSYESNLTSNEAAAARQQKQ